MIIMRCHEHAQQPVPDCMLTICDQINNLRHVNISSDKRDADIYRQPIPSNLGTVFWLCTTNNLGNRIDGWKSIFTISMHVVIYQKQFVFDTPNPIRVRFLRSLINGKSNRDAAWDIRSTRVNKNVKLSFELKLT